MAPNKNLFDFKCKVVKKKKTAPPANSVHEKKKENGHPHELPGCHLKADAWGWDEFIKLYFLGIKSGS